MMKMMTKQKYLIAFIICIIIFSNQVSAQCSVCTKTAEQLGEGPASALNSAIVYLMMIPLIIMGFYRILLVEERKTYYARRRYSRKLINIVLQ
jgi:hypothetical protein